MKAKIQKQQRFSLKKYNELQRNNIISYMENNDIKGDRNLNHKSFVNDSMFKIFSCCYF